MNNKGKINSEKRFSAYQSKEDPNIVLQQYTSFMNVHFIDHSTYVPQFLLFFVTSLSAGKAL